MINLIIMLLLLTISTVFIIDYSGIVTDISKYLYEKANPGQVWLGQMVRKPFSCSLCMTFWLTLIISLFTTTIIYALFLATMFAIISLLIKKLMGKLINLINTIE